MDFAVLGPLEVTDEGVRLDLGGLRQRRLLAQLLLRANEVVSLDRLVASVWDGDDVPDTADRVIRSYVSRLRRSLQPDASADDLRALIPARAPGYVLEVDPDRVDAARVERLSAEGTARLGVGEVDAALELFDQALSLWRGRSYDEFADQEWATPEAQRLEELRSQIVEEQIESRLRLAHHMDLVGELEALVERYPLRERMWGHLMLAQYRCGRQADALRTYQTLRSTLVEEVGIDPSPSVQELEQRILQQDPALDVDLPDKIVRAAATRRLPAPRTSLIGREADLSEIARALRSSRLVTVIGVGGVGKTRVTLEVARRVASEFGDGVWWAELAPVGDRADVLSVVASALDLRPNPGVDMIESIIGGIGDQKLLLVIDNCDHVIDHSYELVDEVLSRCPNARILVSSRESLAVEGESVTPLQPLARRETDEDPDPAVELLVERAYAAGAELAGDDDVIAEICQRLDRLPLAIELAAGLPRSLTASEIRDGIDNRFELLVGARRTTDRHRTLRNTLSWSYDLLDDTNRDLLCWLAVFAGSLSFDDLQRVSGLGHAPVLTGLRDLVNKSLVVATPSGGRTHYRLLETVREFAADQLEAMGFASDRRTGHAHAFADLAIELGERSRGPDEADAVHRGVASIDNFREAFRWAELTGDADTALTIVTELFDIAKWTGLYEVLGWADSALAIPGARETPRGATAIAISGESALMRGDLPQAERLAMEAIAMDPPPHRPSLAHYVYAGAPWFAGDVATMRERISVMREVAERTGARLDELMAISQELATRRNEPGAQMLMDQVTAIAHEFDNSMVLSQLYIYRGGIRGFDDPACHLDRREAASIAARCGYRVTEERANRMAATAEGLVAEDPTPQLAELIEMAARLRGPEMALELCHTLALAKMLLVQLQRWNEVAVVGGFGEATLEPWLDPQFGHEIEDIEREAHRAIGAEQFDSWWTRGAQMSLTEVLDLVRANDDRPAPNRRCRHLEQRHNSTRQPIVTYAEPTT